jgi:hypothetical protein
MDYDVNSVEDVRTLLAAPAHIALGRDSFYLTCQIKTLLYSFWTWEKRLYGGAVIGPH